MLDQTNEFENHTALVTGGASGIGRATACMLADRGAFVVALDRNEEGVEEVIDEIRSAGGQGCAYSVDLASVEAIESMAERIVTEHGPPHVLVNAAGWDKIGRFIEVDDSDLELLLRVNLMGPMRLTRALLPSMLASKAEGRSIVNVASDAGRVGSSGETVYAGAKGGVIAFTKSLAREMARDGMRVNCVCPGPTDTPLFATLPDNLREALVRSIPFRRLARPEEIGDAILFFASGRSSFVTGQILSVSGGLTMAG